MSTNRPQGKGAKTAGKVPEKKKRSPPRKNASEQAQFTQHHSASRKNRTTKTQKEDERKTLNLPGILRTRNCKKRNGTAVAKKKGQSPWAGTY